MARTSRSGYPTAASITNANKASVMSNSVPDPVEHGGDVAAARALFPDAPEPFLDLSTGINPRPYPMPALPPEIFTRLPDPAALARLAAVAATAYGAPSATHVVAASGTQILLPLVAALRPRGRAAVLTPTYGEHARIAALVGHTVDEVTDFDRLADADLAIVTNPNNPDGRLVAKNDLIALADRLRGGLLVIDEAFMDVGPSGASLAEVPRDNIVVLRSFGKFYGLAGIRLGFALGAPDIVARLRATLGPWAVSGPAIAVGAAALADTAWRDATRGVLSEAARRLDAMLSPAGLEVVGGTSLFRLARAPAAHALAARLARQGILVRSFARQPTWLRFGLPADETAWQRLRAALTLAAEATPS
jgi:cobalamin biosynthetic protein CobC